MPRNPRVLFLCTGNSCRSQMAEGWAKQLLRDRVEAFSAGVETHGLNPDAVKVMAEAGVDISAHRSKLVTDIDLQSLDLVITVCDNARESCPVFPGKARVIHHGFEDPPALARGSSSREETLGHYRRVRDEIRRMVEDLPVLLQSAGD